jgi:hypothetical protein
MELFRKNINEYFTTQFLRVKSEIDNISEKSFMEYDPEDLADKKLKEAQLRHLTIDLANRESFVNMVSIHGSKFQVNYYVDRNSSYQCAKISYYYTLPKQGDLLSYAATEYSLNRNLYRPILVSTTHDKLIISYQTLHGSDILSEEVKQTVKQTMVAVHEDINKAISAINKDIDKFNTGLKDVIIQLIKERRTKISLKNDQNDDLNNF